ncbi:hypothetical protein OV208_12665 [Corallococcus sp. bb12-1]|uniref:NACHT domain-containing protein n=1 Tax=Corallococcus sp. bb12-1 TaxID=2996784 RepID=UPI002270E88F|nr:hypothetical protein [Corallococcus sp. bb12-1]MCY1042169.1 hypothetical protein [Corallococcus sp. bb12-1]
MNRSEVRDRLQGFMRRGQLHLAWAFALKRIESPGDPSLRRGLKHQFLRAFLLPRLPASFWNEHRREEARRLGVVPFESPLRVGEMAFPVVFPSSQEGCFVSASVRFSEGARDEFPQEGEAMDASARRAMEEALEAARRLTGEQRRFRVVLDRPFAEPMQGASCGLAVALAALSCIDGLELDDSLAATGEVSREGSIRPVRDLDRKLAMLLEARPLARLLCPVGHAVQSPLLPVLRIEDARTIAWKPNRRILEKALTTFKHMRMQDPALCRLQFRGLAKIARGDGAAELQLLDFAVAPSLRNERTEHVESEAELHNQLRNPRIPKAARHQLESKLRQLEQRSWNSRNERDDAAHSFAWALHCARRMIVIGDPGAGKSVLTRLAFLACAEGETGTKARSLLGADVWYRREEARAIRFMRYLLPVRLVLGEFGQALMEEGTLTLELFIRRQLRKDGAAPALMNGLDNLLQRGRLLLMCDGLDEVPEGARGRVVDAVSALIRSHPKVRMLVTSRPHGYAPRVADFQHFTLAPLDYGQRRTLVARIHRLVEAREHPGSEGVRRARRRTSALLQAISQRKEWEELISNPLLLTLSALARPNANGVPEHQVVVFEGFIQTILQEWRSALKRPAEQAEHLLEAWYAVAFDLVQAELRHGVGEARLLQMLAEALAPHASIDANRALFLALEAGLVRETGRSIAFWHSAFAEFLAARFLAARTEDTDGYLLKRQLTPLTLKFSVALLDHVFEAPARCDALARAKLSQDEEGANVLLRPGLRTVSDWIADGIRFAPDIQERVWEAWIEILESAPPSPLWVDFGRFADRAQPESLDSGLVARLARVDAHRVQEVREGIAQIVAPAAAKEPAARASCEQWLLSSEYSPLRSLGAFGLAVTGDWSDAVIRALSRFGRTTKLSPQALSRLVQGSATMALPRLQSLVGQRFASEAPGSSSQGISPEEARPETASKELRLSAACLLAVAGEWNDDVAWVMKAAFSDPQGGSMEEELQSVMRFCSHESVVREALLTWLSDDSPLGDRARKLVREVAPLHEDMPEKVLERMAGTQGARREKLEELLVSIGGELHNLPEVLRQGLEDAQWGERRLCTAQVLIQLSGQDPLLHESLRRGMRSGEPMDRARWAHLARRLETLTPMALETLADCSRSPDVHVRAMVYGPEPSQLKWQLRTERLEGWLAVASDPGVVAQARLDALHAVERVTELHSQVGPILRELLFVEDARVRWSAAQSLFWREEFLPEAAVILTQEAVRGGRDSYVHLRELRKGTPVAGVVVRTLLHELSGVALPADSQGPFREASKWVYVLEELVEAKPSCVQTLLEALDLPGLAGRVSWSTLGSLMRKHALVRDMVRAALGETMTARSAITRFHLIQLGLQEEETRPEAIALSRYLDPGSLPQESIGSLAYLLHQAGEPREAARLWRHDLEGTNPQWVLNAADMLLLHFPEEALSQVQAVIHRVLDSPTPEHRVGAGRFALRVGVHEEEACKALIECLKTKERHVDMLWGRDWFRYLPISRQASRAIRDEERLKRIQPHMRPRNDFAAMEELCALRPDTGLPLLAAWLEDEDFERFSYASELLAEDETYRAQVRSAMAHRLRSDPPAVFQRVIQFIEARGFYSEHLVEEFLNRYDEVEESARYRFDSSISDWLRMRPGIWTVLRKQASPRRSKVMQWLEFSPPLHRHMVAFAVEFVLEHTPDSEARYTESILERWCTRLPEQKEDAQEESQEPRPPSWVPEQVRGWMHEVLQEQKSPGNLFVASAFDRLAATADLPAGERIPRLRQTLSMDVSLIEGEDDRFQYFQGLAALQLLELGDQDPHIFQSLETTVHTLAKGRYAETLQFATALLSQRPPDDALRSCLLKWVSHTYWISLNQILDLLKGMGLTVQERIKFLSVRMQNESARTDPLGILDALAELGCPPEHRAKLLLTHINELPERRSTQTLLELASRPELTVIDHAKLALTALAPSKDRGSNGAVGHWVARFASQAHLSTEDHWSSYADSVYLVLRQRTLAKLSKVDDPALVDQALAELSTSHSEALLSLYRPARKGGDLSNKDWGALKTLLATGPPDSEVTLFAKEWLMLGLWQTLEPETIHRWHHS